VILAIIGATGTGKSELALDVAERLRGRGAAAEIVNADASQLYAGMDIGTAKVAAADRRGIPHHLFDALRVTDEASVADYQEYARAVITDILGRGALPIVVGGSGLYVSSVVFDFRFPGTDPVVRAHLEGRLTTEGPGLLYRELTAKDPDAATAIGPHNGRRLVRALEVIAITGKKFGSGLPDAANMWHPTTFVGLRSDRATLIQRLDERVESMWGSGLLEEVEGLLVHGLEGGVTASRAIGYAQAIAQLRGEMSETEAVASAQALTRRYARRQVSWFRRYPGVTWLDAGDADNPHRAVEALEATITSITPDAPTAPSTRIAE
jgi:tRNA dimethylallyltransferase